MKMVKTGRPVSKETRKKISDNLSYTDKKKVVTYGSYHRRVWKRRGKAFQCEQCHTLTAKRYEWANKSGKYEDLNDYIQLCSSCHKRLDNIGHRNLPKSYNKECLDCKKKFKAKIFLHYRCGNIQAKTGCAYIRFNKYHLKRYHDKRRNQ